MTPDEYKQLIKDKYKEITNEELYLTPHAFEMFASMARTFESGNLVLSNWEKFLKDGDTNITDFIDYMVDVYYEMAKESPKPE